MNIYQDAVDRAVEFWAQVFEEKLGEKVSREEIKARYEELRETAPEQFEAEFGTEELLHQARIRGRQS